MLCYVQKSVGIRTTLDGQAYVSLSADNLLQVHELSVVLATRPESLSKRSLNHWSDRVAGFGLHFLNSSIGRYR